MFLGSIGSSSSSGISKPYCSNIDQITGNDARIATHHQSMRIGKNWMEYQGSKNWEGLMDPLDDKLRWEIMRYGKFVEVAYDSSSSAYATSRFPKRSLFKNCGLRNTGYQVTKHLRATSSVQLPRWTKKAPSWLTNQSSWIGYVAVCQDDEEISRLGRRDVVVAYRGTTTFLEWVENLRATLTKLPCCANGDGKPMVESGFLSLYTGKTAKYSLSLQEQVREEIGRILESYSDEPLSLTITGHSLGAALATLTALDIRRTFDNPPMVTVVSFGAPRVGNRTFRQVVEKSGCKILRIVNPNDLITKVPGFVIHDDNGEIDDDDQVIATKVWQWLKKRIEDSPWDYANVGRELRLSSNNSPLLTRPSIDVATSHELDTYLQLVNVCMSSTCPFKSTTSRVFSSSLGK